MGRAKPPCCLVTAKGPGETAIVMALKGVFGADEAAR
jgi:hypothetical protein